MLDDARGSLGDDGLEGLAALLEGFQATSPLPSSPPALPIREYATAPSRGAGLVADEDPAHDAAAFWQSQYQSLLACQKQNEAALHSAHGMVSKLQHQLNWALQVLSYLKLAPASDVMEKLRSLELPGSPLNPASNSSAAFPSQPPSPTNAYFGSHSAASPQQQQLQKLLPTPSWLLEPALDQLRLSQLPAGTPASASPLAPSPTGAAPTPYRPPPTPFQDATAAAAAAKDLNNSMTSNTSTGQHLSGASTYTAEGQAAAEAAHMVYPTHVQGVVAGNASYPVHVQGPGHAHAAAAHHVSFNMHATHQQQPHQQWQHGSYEQHAQLSAQRNALGSGPYTQLVSSSKRSSSRQLEKASSHSSGKTKRRLKRSSLGSGSTRSLSGLNPADYGQEQLYASSNSLSCHLAEHQPGARPQSYHGGTGHALAGSHAGLGVGGSALGMQRTLSEGLPYMGYEQPSPPAGYDQPAPSWMANHHLPGSAPPSHSSLLYQGAHSDYYPLSSSTPSPDLSADAQAGSPYNNSSHLSAGPAGGWAAAPAGAAMPGNGGPHGGHTAHPQPVPAARHPPQKQRVKKSPVRMLAEDSGRPHPCLGRHYGYECPGCGGCLPR